MKLKDKIKAYRQENKLTQQQLADMLNVSRSNIAEIEAGRIKGTLKFVTKLSEVSCRPITYWTDEDIDEIEQKYHSYEALDIVIDAMIDKGMIDADGNVSEKGKDLLMGILEKEIKMKCKKRKE